MKIIHTGDWHIGKIVNEYSMIEDQRFYLNKMIELLKNEKPDVLLIAGDIYDRSVPSSEAVELLDDVLSSIILDLKIPILAIAGNHDSPERVSFGSKMLKNKGLYIEGMPKKEVCKVTLADEYGNVNFYLVPYAEPAVVRNLYEDESIKTHDDAMRCITHNIESNMNKDERNVIVCHGYVTYHSQDVENKGGLETLDSERPLSIGGSDLIDARIFNSFNYVALGHLHGPQKVGSDRIRYSGSLLKYSVDEYRQSKSIPIINMDKDGKVDVSLNKIKPLRDIRKIHGPIAELMNRDNHKGENLDDYVFAEITDEGEVFDGISKIRAVFPNVMGLKRDIKNDTESEGNSAAKGNFKEKSVKELFSEFYLAMTDKEMDEKRESVIDSVLKDVLKEEI
ncbi:exonuclease SbcCD subunit D [Clostridium sp. BJN0001]|uniref:exonuclease SbcCD subunit D n=1 Tax=Clostridium sp. BJN0001 TaxID=2930219 RepID=UPI001FD164A6|nr:exonuclease SbcCD subunit D [Clostridium sp. BJN0001]